MIKKMNNIERYLNCYFAMRRAKDERFKAYWKHLADHFWSLHLEDQLREAK